MKSKQINNYCSDWSRSDKGWKIKWLKPNEQQNTTQFSSFHRLVERYTLIYWKQLGKVSIKQNIKSYRIFHTGVGGGGYPISITLFGEKKMFFPLKIQRWSEWSNSTRTVKTLIFHYWGGDGMEWYWVLGLSPSVLGGRTPYCMVWNSHASWHLECSYFLFVSIIF